MFGIMPEWPSSDQAGSVTEDLLGIIEDLSHLHQGSSGGFHTRAQHSRRLSVAIALSSWKV